MWENAVRYSGFSSSLQRKPEHDAINTFLSSTAAQKINICWYRSLTVAALTGAS
jgi:hypothetical protein